MIACSMTGSVLSSLGSEVPSSEKRLFFNFQIARAVKRHTVYGGIQTTWYMSD